jgi:hypothetical protein
LKLLTAFITVALSSSITKTGDDASGDPASNNGNNAKTDLLSNGRSGRRKIKEVMKLYTVEKGMADSDVREVHAESVLGVAEY